MRRIFIYFIKKKQHLDYTFNPDLFTTELMKIYLTLRALGWMEQLVPGLLFGGRG